jgi:cell envelope opacity-associated protein A
VTKSSFDNEKTATNKKQAPAKRGVEKKAPPKKHEPVVEKKKPPKKHEPKSAPPPKKAPPKKTSSGQEKSGKLQSGGLFSRFRKS